MTYKHRLKHLLLLLFLAVFAGSASGCLGCSARSEAPSAEGLRAEFAEQSAQVLDGERAFVASREGFTVALPSQGEQSAPRRPPRGVAERRRPAGPLRARGLHRDRARGGRDRGG